MPEILFNTFDDNSKFVVWQAVEDINFFKDKTKLTLEEKIIINKIKTVKRKTEIYCVRYILQNILNCKKIISYNNNAKPIIDKKNKISISHSNNFIAVYLSNKDIGIDIEKISEKSLRVKEKFISNSEISLLKKYDDKAMYCTLFWSVKETVFKLFSDKHLAFIENIKIQNLAGNNFEGEIVVKIKLIDFIIEQKVFYKKNANFVITWAQK